MRRLTRKKRAVIGVVTLVGLAVFVVSGFALKRPIVEQWHLWKMDSQDEEEQRAAIQRLAEMRSVRAVPRLIPMLRLESVHQPRLGLAGTALAAIGPPAIPYLLEACDDKDTYVGLTVAAVLGAMGPPALPRLVEALESRNDSVRLFVKIAFSRIGPPATPTAEALEHRDTYVRAAAAHLMAMQGEQAVAAVPRLVEMLRDEHRAVRAAAAEALGVIHPGGQDIIPALLSVRNDESAAVRAAVAEALGGTSLSGAAVAMGEALLDAEASVRLAATESMARLTDTPAAREALPALASRLGDPDEHVRRAAETALTEFGLSLGNVKALIEKFLALHSSGEAHEAAARALERVMAR